MTKDEALAMDLALEALEQGIDGQTSIQMDKAITAIKQARSAPAQEPVAFNAGVPPLYPEMKDGETISVEYTTPPASRRQWQGLTDEEMHECAGEFPWTPTGLKCVRAIEAKLRSKNNG